MKKKEFTYRFAPVNKFGSPMKEVKMVGLSFKSKKEAFNWLKNNASVFSKAIVEQFKDQLVMISKFYIYLYKDNRLVKTLEMRFQDKKQR